MPLSKVELTYEWLDKTKPRFVDLVLNDKSLRYYVVTIVDEDTLIFLLTCEDCNTIIIYPRSIHLGCFYTYYWWYRFRGRLYRLNTLKSIIENKLSDEQIDWWNSTFDYQIKYEPNLCFFEYYSENDSVCLEKLVPDELSDYYSLKFDTSEYLSDWSTYSDYIAHRNGDNLGSPSYSYAYLYSAVHGRGGLIGFTTAKISDSDSDFYW